MTLLGRKQSPTHLRAATPDLSFYADPKKMVPPPLRREWSIAQGRRTPVSMFDNDRISCCTVASIAHHDQIAGAQVGDPSPLTSADVLKLFRGSGWSPSEGEGDGWSCLEAARAARSAGWVDGYVKCEIISKGTLELIINEFGGAYLGIDLPLSAQKQLGKVWEVGEGDDFKAGTWGGHAVTAVDFDRHGITVATWGSYQRMSWEFALTYVDELIALLLKRWRAQTLSPSGVRFDEMRADLARLP